MHVLFIDCETDKTANLETKLSKFWDLEAVGVSKNGKSYDEFFDETISRKNDNRFKIRLPFKSDYPILLDNLLDKKQVRQDNSAKNRMLKLQEKLKSDKELAKKYNDIFIEQRRQGIIENANEPGEIGETHYLAHHPVIGEDKRTTKVRIVFDAYAETVEPSVNDCL